MKEESGAKTTSPQKKDSVRKTSNVKEERGNDRTEAEINKAYQYNIKIGDVQQGTRCVLLKMSS